MYPRRIDDVWDNGLITGIWLKDEEGALHSTDITVVFDKGEPTEIVAILVLKSLEVSVIREIFVRLWFATDSFPFFSGVASFHTFYEALRTFAGLGLRKRCGRGRILESNISCKSQ